jgi:hypothetical protein
MSKGQAATEFMLTYSWSIMIVLTMMGLIVYFGVMQPESFLTESCVAGIGFACKGSSLTDSQIQFSLTNGIGSTLVLNTTNIVIPQNCTDIYLCDFGDTTCTDTSKSIPETADFTVVANCDNEKYFKGDFVFHFNNINSGLPTVVTVTISGSTN